MTVCLFWSLDVLNIITLKEDLLHGMEKVAKVQEVRNGKSSEIRPQMMAVKEVMRAEVVALVKEWRKVARTVLVNLRYVDF